VRVVLLIPIFAACSTTYVIQTPDVERLKQGAQISNLKDLSQETVDFTHYAFVYKEKDREVPLKIKGIESLNSMASAGQLHGLQTLTAVPQKEDHAWQRTVLGGGVGLAAGLGVGFAVSNRIILERSATPDCTYCTPGYTALGTIVSGVVGAAVGSLIAYFAAAKVGSTRVGMFEFFGDFSSSMPATVPSEK